MNFERGDIVKIVKYPISDVVGLTAEVREVLPQYGERIAKMDHSQFPIAWLVIRTVCPGETWYALTDVTGCRRAAPHSWLERADPVPLTCVQEKATA